VAAADADSPQKLSNDELPRARAAYPYMADRRILGRLEARARAVLRNFDVPIRAREPRLHVEPSDWRAGFLRVGERWIPDALLFDLKVLTPQALLRDLYRPIRALQWYEREPIVEFDRAGMQGFAEARAAQKLPPRPVIEPLVQVVIEHRRLQRELVQQRWQPFMPDSEPRKSVGVFHEPSLMR
jgi:hypothetical protein